MRRVVFVVAVVVATVLGAADAQAATITATSAADSGAGSLRAAVAAAGTGDTVKFAASLDGQTIHVTSGAIGIGKDLTIEGPGSSSLSLDAGGTSQIFTVSAADLSISGLTLTDGAASAKGGAIDAEGPGSLSVSGSTFVADTAGAAGGPTDFSDQGKGGAIYDEGTSMSVSGCTFIGDAAGGRGGEGEGSGAGWGGAIYVSTSSPSTISASTFTEDTAGGEGAGGLDSGLGSGGAIYEAGGSLTISGSDIARNTAGGEGGGGFNSGVGFGGAVHGSGSLDVLDSTIAENSAGGQGGEGADSGGGSGGGIDSAGSLTVSGSTLVGNDVGGTGGIGSSSGSAGGGAIFASGGSLISISNSTLTGNEAGGAGAEGFGGAIQLSDHTSAILKGLTIDANAVGGNGEGAAISGAFMGRLPVTAQGTLISGNTGATNCEAPVSSSDHSLEGPLTTETSCGLDLPSADPQLEPLADNGGPTETQALPESSPAVDAIPAADCPEATDQRGEPRPSPGDGFCDVGAFEFQHPVLAPAITSAAAATFQVGKGGAFVLTASGLPAPSFSVAGALPDGVTFKDDGGGEATVSGTPAVGSGGTYALKVKAANGVSPEAEQSFALTVQAPPGVSVQSPVDGAIPTQGQTVASRFTCTEGTAGTGIASCLDQGGHPSGAALDTATTGHHTLTVTATSRDGLVARSNVGYTVVSVTSPKKPSKPKPRVLVSYRRWSGPGRSGSSLVVYSDHSARLTSGGCKATPTIGRQTWSRLNAALKRARLHANAGRYPAPRGSSSRRGYVLKADGNVVRVALPQPGHKKLRRALGPLLKVLNGLVGSARC